MATTTKRRVAGKTMTKRGPRLAEVSKKVNTHDKRIKALQQQFAELSARISGKKTKTTTRKRTTARTRTASRRRKAA